VEGEEEVFDAVAADTCADVVVDDVVFGAFFGELVEEDAVFETVPWPRKATRRFEKKGLFVGIS
jgi:hypothetical protein